MKRKKMMMDANNHGWWLGGRVRREVMVWGDGCEILRGLVGGEWGFVEW